MSKKFDNLLSSTEILPSVPKSINSQVQEQNKSCLAKLYAFGLVFKLCFLRSFP